MKIMILEETSLVGMYLKDCIEQSDGMEYVGIYSKNKTMNNDISSLTDIFLVNFHENDQVAIYEMAERILNNNTGLKILFMSDSHDYDTSAKEKSYKLNALGHFGHHGSWEDQYAWIFEAYENSKHEKHNFALRGFYLDGLYKKYTKLGISFSKIEYYIMWMSSIGLCNQCISRNSNLPLSEVSKCKEAINVKLSMVDDDLDIK